MERIQQIADRTSLAAQQNAAELAEQQRLKAEGRVQDPQEVEDPELDADAENANADHEKKKREKKDDEDHSHGAGDEPVIDDGSEPHRLDVTI